MIKIQIFLYIIEDTKEEQNRLPPRDKKHSE